MNKSRPELKAPLTVVGRLSVLVDIQAFLLYPSANAQAKELVKQFHAREGVRRAVYEGEKFEDAARKCASGDVTE